MPGFRLVTSHRGLKASLKKRVEQTSKKRESEPQTIGRASVQINLCARARVWLFVKAVVFNRRVLLLLLLLLLREEIGDGRGETLQHTTRVIQLLVPTASVKRSV